MARIDTNQSSRPIRGQGWPETAGSRHMATVGPWKPLVAVKGTLYTLHSTLYTDLPRPTHTPVRGRPFHPRLLHQQDQGFCHLCHL